MMKKLLIIAHLFHLVQYTYGWSLVTSRPVDEPEETLVELADAYSRQDTFRLNDVKMGLTAYKDKKLASCFVNDYDPLWLPGPSDKRYIIHSQPCEKVDKNTDFSTLKKKAGPDIASMCKDLYIFWLAARNMAPPPLPGVFQKPSRPCPYDDVLPLQSPTELGPKEEIVPPILYEGAQPMSPNRASPLIDDGAPPMIDSGAPPRIDDGARRMIANGPPPIIDNGPPPRIDDGAPPMIGNGAPPMIGAGAPAMLRDNVPPMYKDGEMQPPPLAENTHSRRDLDVLPVIQTPPPALPAIQTQPPTLSEMIKMMIKANRNVDIIVPPTPDMKTPPPPKQLRRNI